MKIFQAHVVEDSDQEFEDEAKKDEDSSEEYVFISSLTRWNDTWMIDIGASKHMTGFKESLSYLEKKESPHKVMLGDDSQYPIKGLG